MTNELYHYGIKNQRWGTRRFQYEDGTLTPEGKERYRKYSESQRAQDRRMYSKGAEKRIEKRISEGEGIKGARSEEANRIERYREASKTNAKIGKVVGAATGREIGGKVGKGGTMMVGGYKPEQSR